MQEPYEENLLSMIESDESMMQSDVEDPGAVNEIDLPAKVDQSGRRLCAPWIWRILQHLFFPGENEEGHWTNGRTSQHGQLGSFLGVYHDGERTSLTVNFQNPPPMINVNFLFYEIGAWRGQGTDRLEVFMNGERLNMGTFGERWDEGTRQGTSANGIKWMMESVTEPMNLVFDRTKLDQVHIIKGETKDGVVCRF